MGDRGKGGGGEEKGAGGSIGLYINPWFIIYIICVSFNGRCPPHPTSPNNPLRDRCGRSYSTKIEWWTSPRRDYGALVSVFLLCR